MSSLITSPIGLVAGITVITAVTLYLQNYKFFKFLGPVMTCIILGVILSNMGVMPFEADVYDAFFTFGIPLSITMFLLPVNIKEWVKLAKLPIISMLIAAFSVFVMGSLGGVLMADKIEEGWKLTGMFVGTYIGGSSNLNAVGTGLGASSNLFGAANAADYVIGLPMMLLLFSLPNLFMKNKFLKKHWPYSLPDDVVYAEQEEGGFFDAKEWSIEEVAILFALGSLVNFVATGLAGYFPAGIEGAIRVILITTFALGLGQIKFFNNLRGSRELGMYISTSFLAVIGLGIDLKQFASAAPLIGVLCAFILFGGFALHVILCRVFKIPYQYLVTSITAAIVDGPTSALVSSSAEWSGLVATSIVVGAIGGALGNYLGFGSAYLVKAILGL